MCVSKTRLRGERKRGLALVGILLMLTVLGMIAVLMASLGSENQRLARAQTESEVALNAAEAGLAVALENYVRDATFQGDANPQGFGSIGQTYQVKLYDESNPAPDGTFIPPNHTLLVSQGWAKSGAVRQVSAMVTEQIETQAHNNALLAGERVFVSGQAQIASVASTNAAVFLAASTSSSSTSTAKLTSTFSLKLSVMGYSLSGTFGEGDGEFSLSYSGDSSTTTTDSLSLKRVAAKSTTTSTSSLKSAPTDGTTTTTAAAAPPPPSDFTVQLDSQAAGTQSTTGESNAHIAVAGDEEGALTLEAGAVVDGELRIPEGADGASVVSDDGSFHSGVNGYNPPAMVPVRLPLVPGDLDLNWTSASSPSSYADSFNGNELKPGAYGDIVVDGGVLELNTEDLGSGGDKDLYVFRSLTLKNGGKVVLKGAAETNDVTSGLYIDEKFEVIDGSLVNETRDPSRLQVYISDGAPVDLDFDEEATAMIYAPGSTVNMDEGELLGNIVGKQVNLGDGAVVNYDPALAGVPPDPWGNGGFYAYKKSYRRR